MNVNKFNITFVTFGGPSNKYRNRVKLLTDQALDMNIFNNIYGFTDLDLKKNSEFWNKHKEFVESNDRGYGYWIWKPFLLLKVLNEINENEFILYADSGCNINDQNSEGLYNYINLLNNSDYGILSFELTHLEKKYNKGDVFFYFKDYDQNKLKNTVQNHATFLLIKKNNHSINFINKWYELASNYSFIDDSQSIISNEPEFIEHRHDQALFSILCKVYGSEKLIYNDDVIIIARDRGYNDDYDESTITIYKNLIK